MESLLHEEIEQLLLKITDKEVCSEQDVNYLLMLMKRNVKSQQYYIDTIEKYREGVVFEGKYMTDVVYSQWSTIDSLSTLHFIMFHTFGKDKQREEERAEQKAEKEAEEKSKETKKIEEMLQSQSIQ